MSLFCACTEHKSYFLILPAFGSKVKCLQPSRINITLVKLFWIGDVFFWVYLRRNSVLTLVES